MYIDSHAHLSSNELFPEIEDLLKRATAAKVDTIVNICTDKMTLERGIVLKKQYKQILLAASATPHDPEEEADLFFHDVEKAASEKLLVAVGETGLDYYYEHASKAVQQKRLVRYFQLALQSNLPVIFHCRDAFDDLFMIAESEYRNKPALLHCFTGTMQEAKKVLDLGWMISFSGIITFKKSEALREVVRYVPLDRMLIETDAPYLAPGSKRGKINEPAFIAETASVAAEIKQVSLEDLAKHTRENARVFFSL